MRYDLLYLLPLQGEETPSNDVLIKIRELLKNTNATIIREEEPSKRKLAYPIARSRYGSYGNVLFEAESAHIPKLKDALNVESGIIRYQIVREEQTAARKQKSVRTKPKRPVAIPSAAPAPLAQKPADEKVNLEELDKKLEELLSGNIT